MSRYDEIEGKIKAIAFYLPQFHPIPENDEWWEKGFTEWTNVRKAQPRFDGHYQPHVPERLGYYDLREPKVRMAQAELARQYGIHGFCYYHYWFNGRRLLETPFNDVLQSGEPDFPFCLCWANENWTRRWDGLDSEHLMTQHYSHEDDLNHIRALIPAFCDPRYIRVDGKPLFLVYRTGLLPDPKRTCEIWREEAIKTGIGELYLVRIENFMSGPEPAPEDVGFDAAVEFAPYWGSTGPCVTKAEDIYPDYRSTDPLLYDYTSCMMSMLARPKPNYKLFRCTFPSWDNSARRKDKPSVFINSSPEAYAFWFAQICRYTLDHAAGDERLLFINAWNEWGEGCHLEPDEKYGLKHLEATSSILRLAHDFHNFTSRLKNSGKLPIEPASWYESVARYFENNGGSEAETADIVRAFAAYSLFTALQDSQESIRSQVTAIIEAKDMQIAALFNSISWKITAPLRKLYERFYLR